MTIFLTGATGQVGSRLLPRLVAAGHDVRALVRGDHTLPEGATSVHADLLDPASLRGALDGVTHVLHLAAVFKTPDAGAIRRANVEGTGNLLTATLEQAPGARFTMASTCQVYGPGLPHPPREDDPTTATSPYATSKVEAEERVRDSGLTWSVVRLSYVYGEGDGHLSGVDGLQRRYGWPGSRSLSLIHHRDIAVAVELALTGALDGHTVNLVDDAPTTIQEMAAVAGVGYPESAAPLDDPWLGRADGTLIRSLGFVPSVPSLYAAQREGLL